MKPRFLIWLEVFIHFLYIIFASPFKFRYDSIKNSYTICTSLPHKILPITIHVFGVLSTFIGIYSYTVQIPYSNPRCMFHSVVAYSRYIIYYASLHTFWTRRQHFIELFKLCQSRKNIEKDGSSFLKVRVAAWSMCIAMILMAFAIDIIQYQEVGASTFQFSHFITSSFGRRGGGKDFEKLFEQKRTEELHHPDSNSSFQFSDPPHYSGHVHAPGSPISSIEFWFAMIYTLITFYVRVCNHVALLFCVLSAVTMRQAAYAFVSSVEKDQDQDRVIEKYMEFCKFGRCLNKVCGLVILASVICSPPFNIVYLIGTFTSFETTGPRIIFYSCMYWFVFFFASEAASKAGEFKEWIIEYGRDDHETQLFAIFVDLSQNPIGIRGVGFTITYGFVAKMFSIIISFTIILLQFETTPTSDMTNTPCH